MFANPGDDCYAELLASHHAATVAHNLPEGQEVAVREKLKLVLPGEKWTLFCHAVSAAVCLQLTEDDHEDVRALADRCAHCAVGWSVEFFFDRTEQVN